MSFVCMDAEHKSCIPIEEHLAVTGELAKAKSRANNLGDLLGDLLAKREEEIERLSTPDVSPVPPTAREITKDALDELIDDLMSNQHGRAESTLKTWRLLLQHFRDSILSYAPPPCNLDGDGYCSTHSSWWCSPNLGEVAGTTDE